jgi:hypothetical protein
MNRITLLGFSVLFALPLMCAAETWTTVPIVDVACSAKVKADPDAHTRDCALMCSKSGFGIITPDGTFLKFDAKGNGQAMAALKGAQKKDHLRATVTGNRAGDTIKVTSLTM